MKKLTFVIFATAMFIWGCNKTNDPSDLKTARSTSKSLEAARTLTQAFLSKETLPTIAGPHWGDIAKADIKGALEGAATGAGAGSAVNGTEGATWGAIIGGLINGASASIDEAKKKEDTPPRVWQPNTVIDNPNNQYDYVGYWHYKVINHALEDDDNYLVNDEFDIEVFTSFAKDILNDSGIIVHSLWENFPDTSFQQAWSFTNTYNLLSPSSFCSTAYSSGHFSSDVNAYLYLFLSAFDIISDVNDFIYYTMQMEEYVTEDEELSEIDKEIILITMATTRYAIQFWPN